MTLTGPAGPVSFQEFIREMHNFFTVIYALDLESDTFMVGNNAPHNLIISDFDAVKMEDMAEFSRDDSFFLASIYSAVDGSFRLAHVQTYKAYSWVDPNLTLAKLIASGVVDAVQVANDIMDRHTASKRN